MSLDPKENREAREREKEKANKKPALNPPFPFRPTQFPLETFGVDAEPPVDKEPTS